MDSHDACLAAVSSLAGNRCNAEGIEQEPIAADDDNTQALPGETAYSTGSDLRINAKHDDTEVSRTSFRLASSIYCVSSPDILLVAVCDCTMIHHPIRIQSHHRFHGIGACFSLCPCSAGIYNSERLWCDFQLRAWRP